MPVRDFRILPDYAKYDRERRVHVESLSGIRWSPGVARFDSLAVSDMGVARKAAR